MRGEDEDGEEEEEVEEEEKEEEEYEEGVHGASLCSILLKRGRNLCARGVCDSGGKRGIGGGIGEISKRGGSQDWPDDARSEEREGKKRKKGGIP